MKDLSGLSARQLDAYRRVLQQLIEEQDFADDPLQIEDLGLDDKFGPSADLSTPTRYPLSTDDGSRYLPASAEPRYCPAPYHGGYGSSSPIRPIVGGCIAGGAALGGIAGIATGVLNPVVGIGLLAAGAVCGSMFFDSATEVIFGGFGFRRFF